MRLTTVGLSGPWQNASENWRIAAAVIPLSLHWH
jgi:hypothetical protein